MSEIVERVARAMCKDGVLDNRGEAYRLARAAIEAMRPTEGMVEAGQSTRCPWHEEIRLIWPAMIDEALR
jgi:hypothetical protein